jgi:hypothetical protein
MSGEMFKSSERLDGGQSGVFEYEGETGYFYLYDISKEDGKQIIGHLHVVSGSIDFSENDVKIVWDAPSSPLKNLKSRSSTYPTWLQVSDSAKDILKVLSLFWDFFIKQTDSPLTAPPGLECVPGYRR